MSNRCEWSGGNAHGDIAVREFRKMPRGGARCAPLVRCYSVAVLPAGCAIVKVM